MRRETCYGYIHDGHKGCRWLEKSPSASVCSICSFFKTEKQYHADVEGSEQLLKSRNLKRKFVNKGDSSYVTVAEDDVW